MIQAPLGEFFQFIRNGMNIRQDKSGDGIPITRIETIWNSTVDASRTGYAGVEPGSADRWLLQDGDILFSHINSVDHVGKCALYQGDPVQLIHGMNLLCLRAEPSRLHPQYAVHLLRSPGFRASLMPNVKRAVNQASVSIRDLSGIQVQIPALEDQERIARILGHVDRLRDKRREAIELLDGLPQSIFLEMFGNPRDNPFGWQAHTVADLADQADRINYGVVQPGNDCESGIPLIRVGDIASGRVERSAIKRIDPLIEAKYSRSRIKGNEILVGCVGSIGSIALVGDSDIGSNIARAVARISFSSNPLREYIAEHFRTADTQRYFKRELRTVAQPTLNIKQLSETVVMVPPADLQAKFASRVSVVRDQQKIQAAHLAMLDSLFASLQHRAFQGELRPGELTPTE
ncbi:restriction endonuclease subunit S [Kitasatospora purpeofusca]|uniref:restriction endonuclease subunit S n=1 Tax=Kitasatospora purpeofusca TaxID=67352 RepID=UPI003F4AEB60